MRHWLNTLLVFLLCSATVAIAQVPEVPPVTDQSDQVQANPEQAVTENNEAQTEQDSESEPQLSDDEPSRFIPTEQISQDLGVSFPADI